MHDATSYMVIHSNEQGAMHDEKSNTYIFHKNGIKIFLKQHLYFSQGWSKDRSQTYMQKNLFQKEISLLTHHKELNEKY